MAPTKTDPLGETISDAPSAEVMLANNINPLTGLASDYLNHFNEAIMLLEMLPDVPECLEDFLAWQPLSYCEHFMASHLGGREVAIKAYEAADPKIRMQFDAITDTMTSILATVANALRTEEQARINLPLAGQSAEWLKTMVCLAGGVINNGIAPDVDTILDRQ